MPDFGYIVERNRLPVHYFVSNISICRKLSLCVSTSFEIACHREPMRLSRLISFHVWISEGIGPLACNCLEEFPRESH